MAREKEKETPYTCRERSPTCELTSGHEEEQVLLTPGQAEHHES
jgi:hypothetical protein